MKSIGVPHNKRNREQRIRISTYQKSCIMEYTVSDRLKFLFSVLCSSFLLLCGAPKSSPFLGFLQKLWRLKRGSGLIRRRNTPRNSWGERAYNSCLRCKRTSHEIHYQDSYYLILSSSCKELLGFAKKSLQHFLLRH